MLDNITLILAEDDDQLTVAMADPLNSFVLQALGLLSGKKVQPRVGIASEIEQALQQSHARKNDTSELSGESNDSAGFLGDVEYLKELASEAPVIKLVNLIINRAAESGASDIHIEPFENELKVRYRIDGLLREIDTPLAGSTAAVVSRIKIMANLNIAERRLPQDGRIRIRAQRKILTVKDPVEYNIAGVNQIQVKPQKGRPGRQCADNEHTDPYHPA